MNVEKWMSDEGQRAAKLITRDVYRQNQAVPKDRRTRRLLIPVYVPITYEAGEFDLSA